MPLSSRHLLIILPIHFKYSSEFKAFFLLNEVYEYKNLSLH